MNSNMPSDRAADFDATPFVSGALTGRRAFRIIRDEDGIHLWGPVYAHDWVVDDVNHAACLSWATQHGALTAPHKVAAQGCKCGWWAYFAETPETRTYRRAFSGGFGVEGIIFGFGLCGAGKRGFRASKARVKALVIPDECKDMELLEEAMDMWRDNNEFRWYGTFDAAARDWPLSSARKYGFDPSVEGAA